MPKEQTSVLPPEAAEQALSAMPRKYRRTGLEGKILAALMILLLSGMTTIFSIWAKLIGEEVIALLGQQARQTALTVSMAAEPAMQAKDVVKLAKIRRDVLKNGNVWSVDFFWRDYSAINLKNPTYGQPEALPPMTNTDLETLGSVQSKDNKDRGLILEVCEPVLSSANNHKAANLIGYARVCVWPAPEMVQVRRVNVFAVAVGFVVALTCLPLAYALVHRIFAPIRELVEATNLIAGGNLDAQVAIDRQDGLGELARSFNAMARTVKGQRDDLQEANRKLAQSNAGLEANVAYRTRQLEAANQSLSREIAEKEDFLRAISHDLNAPLRNIAGMASMLLMKHRETLDKDVIHRLERIQKNVEVETDLIGELLELSRIKTRQQKMELVETEAIVRSLGEIFENDLKTRNIELILDTTLPVLRGDPARLRQVFQNLIDNAIKYMGDEPPCEIHFGCALRESEAEFYVRDTGMGIHPDDIEKVFCVFRRGRNTAALGIAGKGVGLSSVKSIIETYNGSISVESELGKGSNFKFTINGQFVPALHDVQNDQLADFQSAVGVLYE
jgi:signal transduction histidine kinase